MNLDLPQELASTDLPAYIVMALLGALTGVVAIVIMWAMWKAWTRLVARRYILPSRTSSITHIKAVAIFGVAIGVATLLVIIAISSGFLSTFREKVLGVNAHVIVLKSSTSFPEYREVMKIAESMDDVTAAAPFIINEMMIVKGNAISGILLKGVDPVLVTRVLDLPEYMNKGGMKGLRLPGAAPAAERILRPIEPPGRLKEDDTEVGEAVEDVLDDDDGGYGVLGGAGDGEPAKKVAKGPDPSTLPGIIIGESLGENIQAKMGDVVRVISTVAGLDTSFWAPGVDASRSLDFRVTGIFYSGFDEYDSRLVYVDLWEAQKFYRQGDSVTGVEMRVRDIDRARPVALALEKKLGGGLYRTVDWEAPNHNLFTALEVQKVALTVVLLLSVLMAALNIISTLIMLVVEKRKEIAVLKSMGAGGFGIMGVFMVAGISIGLIGLAGGMGAGWLACLALGSYRWPLDPKVYLIDHLPLETGALDYVLTALATMVICALFTMIPSIHASLYRPVDGLKHE